MINEIVTLETQFFHLVVKRGNFVPPYANSAAFGSLVVDNFY